MIRKRSANELLLSDLAQTYLCAHVILYVAEPSADSSEAYRLSLGVAVGTAERSSTSLRKADRRFASSERTVGVRFGVR
jgi:hypothetical protein